MDQGGTARNSGGGWPRLRPGITLVPRSKEAGGGIIVADREGRRHFWVGDLEGRLIGMLDGSRSLAEICQRLQAEFPAAGLLPETVTRFVELLDTMGLLEGSALPSRRRALSLASLLYLKVPLGNPECFFRAVVERCPFLFTRGFWGGAAALIVLALWIGSASWSELRQDSFHLHSLSGLVLAWASFALIGTIHEMGHGLTCTYYGAPATRWGLLFMYFMPCAYCDVSAAWTLPKKSQRLAVGAAGLAFQWVAGAVALLLWRLVDPGTVLARVLATMAGTCGLASLLNLWPFLRLDGYYLLSDILEIPNLRTRSMAQLAGRMKSFFLGLRGPEVASDPREERILAVYGVGVAVWTIVMLWIVAHRLLHLFVAWWGGLGVIASVVVLLAARAPGVLGWVAAGWRTLWQGGSALGTDPNTEHRTPNTERWRWPFRLQPAPALCLAAGILLLLVPLGLNVSGSCRLEAARRVVVHARADGVLAQFNFREGARVCRGSILGSLDRFETRQELAQLEARLRMVRAERAALEARVPIVAAQTEQLAAESRAGLQRARTDLAELAAELPPRARAAAGRTAQATAEARRAAADLQEARASMAAQARTSTRLRRDLARAEAGHSPPALAALSERARKCHADRKLADQQRSRIRTLVAQGAVAAQELDRAEAVAEGAAREEQMARGDLAAGFKALREAAEDAEAELTRRRAALRAAEAAVTAAGAACGAAVQEEQRVRAQCRPDQLVSAQRLVAARDTALAAAVARRGETAARREEIAARQQEVRRLAAQIAVLRQRLRNSILRSPVDGIVTTPRVEERVGRHFDKGDSICAIEVPTVMSARIFIPEKEMGVVTVGAPVYLKVAAFPEQTFAGKVTEIAPVARRRGNNVTCEVRIRVPNSHGSLRPEMSGWAKIACGRKPLGVLVTRRLTRYLRTEAWSWF